MPNPTNAASEAINLLSAKPGARTWDDGKRCAECCTHMRCDADCTDRDRENCPHCLGTGWALWTAAGMYDYLVNYRKIPIPTAAAPGEEATFQARVAPWMAQCFGSVISHDVRERGDRFLEEALELLQANGYDRTRVATLVDYVWGRPIGEPSQEVGGVMVTLAAYCLATGLDMHVAGETELARIWTKVEQIRAKQAAKRGLHTPLPVAPDPQLAGEEAVAFKDPHHDGDIRWKWENGRLYQQHVGQSKWVEAKRIHVTPARIKALAEALATPSLAGQTHSAEPVAKVGKKWPEDHPLVRALIIESERAIAQAKRGEVDANGKGWDTCFAYILGQHLPIPAPSQTHSAPGGDEQSLRDLLGDLLRIGSAARTNGTIIANVQNLQRFAEQQDAIEREFFMVPGEADPDYPDEEPDDVCSVNRWGSTTAEYVEQFRAALAAIAKDSV